MSLRLHLSSPLSLLYNRTHKPITGCFFVSMSTHASKPLVYSLTLPTQPGHPVEVTALPGISDSDFRNAIESSLFKQWLKNLQSPTGVLANEAFLLKKVLIQGVDMFGHRLGFLKFKADIIYKETEKRYSIISLPVGLLVMNSYCDPPLRSLLKLECEQMVPGIVFTRGPAVAVLILLESGNETYAVLTEQARVPTGRLVLELPAGMLDDDQGDFVGTTAREVEEEIVIHLKLEDMIDLTAFPEQSTGCRIFPSPGGCDEEISVFLYKGRVDKEVITQLQGKESGLREHGELIKVRVVPYGQLWRMNADAKVLMAIALYEMAKKEGLLPLKS